MGVRTFAVPVGVNAGGTAAATLAFTGTGQRKVLQISVQMKTAPVGATCEIDLNGTFVSALIPTGDVADGEPALPLLPTDVVTVNFAGCTPGQTGTVLFIYDDGFQT